MDKKDKLEYIVNHYTKLMHKAAYEVLSDYHEAEDACQEAFIKLYEVLDQLEDITSVRTRNYCIVTARNMAVDLARKRVKQLHKQRAEDEIVTEEIYDDYTYETFELLKDVDELPDKYRNIIRMRCFEGVSATEAARLTGSKLSTVNSQLLRARQMLKGKWASIACFCAAICILAGILYASQRKDQKVQYAASVNEIQLEETGPSGMKASADPAELFSALEETCEETDSMQELSDSLLYEKLDEAALSEVEGATKENILKRELIEESETEFYYEVTIDYDGITYVIRLNPFGEIISNDKKP